MGRRGPSYDGPCAGVNVGGGCGVGGEELDTGGQAIGGPTVLKLRRARSDRSIGVGAAAAVAGGSRPANLLVLTVKAVLLTDRGQAAAGSDGSG